MPTVSTKTLNRLSTGGKLYTRVPMPVSYDEALKLEEDDRLKVTFTRQDHADYHRAEVTRTQVPEAAKAAPEDEVVETPAVAPATAPTTDAPATYAERKEAMLEAFTALDLDVESNFTKAGLPDARALTAILGWTVTAEERNQVFGAQKVENIQDLDDKPKGKITIKTKTGAQALDTGADLVSDVEADDSEDVVDDEDTDPTTDGAVEV